MKAARVTLSDRASAGVYEDRSGPEIARVLGECNFPVDEWMTALIPDEQAQIESLLRKLCDEDRCALVLTTGGTGPSRRDVTPEAVRPLFDKEIEGFNVVWHLVSFQSVGTSTLQSRACAGVANATFIFCLPGSNGAVKDGWDKLIRWQLYSRHMPCNLFELMPRLLES